MKQIIAVKGTLGVITEIKPGGLIKNTLLSTLRRSLQCLPFKM